MRLNLRFKKFSKRSRALKALISRGIEIIGRVDGDDETFSLYGTWGLQKSGVGARTLLAGDGSQEGEIPPNQTRPFTSSLESMMKSTTSQIA